MIKLRPYQNDARYQANTLINAKRHPCLVCPTGGGKTKTAVKIIEDQIKLKKKIFVLTSQEEIFNQWIAELSEFNPGIINQKGIQGKNRNVYICMPMSLINILNHMPENLKPCIIITDETHHSAAYSWKSIYNQFSNAVRLGLTATPQRTDGKGLDDIYTDIVQTINIKKLIESGNLAKPLTIVPKQYLKDIPIVNGEYDLAAQSIILSKLKIIGNIIEKYAIIFGGLPVLVACSTFEHAKKMKESFCEAGWNWDHIHSSLPKHERKRMLREITNGKLNGLCTVGIGTEGLDIPGLYGLIWLRRTISLTIYLQFNGRILRPLKGKTHGIIIDPVGNCFIHGLPEENREWTLKGREKKKNGENETMKMKLCKSCGVMNSPKNTNCHFCGCLIKTTSTENNKIPAIIDGELVAINNCEIPLLKKRAETIIEKQQIEKNSKSETIELSDIEKSSFIRKNIFKNKRKLLKETIKAFS